VKFGAIIVLLIFLAGIVYPSHLTFTRADGNTYLVSVNVCDIGGPSLSVDSKIPALLAVTTSAMLPVQRELTFKAYRKSYQFMFFADLFRPPSV
jgi:hypothetical protein